MAHCTAGVVHSFCGCVCRFCRHHTSSAVVSLLQTRALLDLFELLCCVCDTVVSSGSFSLTYAEPNNASPLNGHAASLWDSQVEYKEHLHNHYKQNN